MTTSAATTSDPRIRDALRQYWGFETLRPMQSQAIDAALGGRDALVVLPTGGGKSLCYQLPPLITGRLTVVASPLIALMKDQVDGLALNGYPAAAINSNVSSDDAADIRARAESGELRLLLVAPERLVTPGFCNWLKRCRVGAFAIDEAHCISQWGHDFRPEYRRLADVRQALGNIPCQAYTATATPQVQRDIVEQLGFKDPAILIGSFDRPNLTYRIRPRTRASQQIADLLGERKNDAAIVYCLSRKDTEAIATSLSAADIPAKAYHAGLTPLQRERVQTAFSEERLNVVVATVAFGMGIDRGDVRLVVHANMPRTVEAYQQETGRAGRDGLPAECVLLHSGADAMRWKKLAQQSAYETGADEGVLSAQNRLIDDMQRLCTSARCRRRCILEYFGEPYPSDNCGACDICLGELRASPEATTIAHKILSCVARMQQPYGAATIADCLIGKPSPKLVERGYDQLSTFGILRDTPRQAVLSYIDQLVGLDLLQRESGQFPVIHLTQNAVDTLRNRAQVSLLEPRIAHDQTRSRRRGSDGADYVPLSPDERSIFESLRALRRALAEERGVAPYLIFGDTTLEQLARERPSTKDAMLNIKGVGATKLADLGETFLEAIREAAAERNLPLDQAHRPSSRAPTRTNTRTTEEPGGAKPDAYQRLDRGESLESIAESLGRAPSTVERYFLDWIAETRPATISEWVPPDLYNDIAAALDTNTTERLKTVHEALNGEAPYILIRAVAAHRRITKSQ